MGISRLTYNNAFTSGAITMPQAQHNATSLFLIHLNIIEMNKILQKIFLILIGIVLIGKMSNWFLNYSDETNQILNAGMFTLIGIKYLFGGFIWDIKLTNVIFIVCGVYLIGMNFIGDFGLKSIIGIVCIITPMLIARFSPEETDEKELAEN
jgi:hypothetical protein